MANCGIQEKVIEKGGIAEIYCFLRRKLYLLNGVTPRCRQSGRVRPLHQMENVSTASTRMLSPRFLAPCARKLSQRVNSRDTLTPYMSGNLGTMLLTAGAAATHYQGSS